MSALKIERVSARHCRIPAEMHFSYGSKTEQNFVLCSVYAGGFVGYGERGGKPDADDEAVARSLIGKDAGRLDALLLEGEPAYSAGAYGIPEMFSMALYDLAGKAQGLPMHELLGNARRRQVPLMPCIFAPSPDRAAEIAQGFLDQRFEALKVKLFGELEGDCAIVRAIRAVMPRGFLQGDANLGYEGIDAGREAMRRLGEAGLTVAEDPFKGTVEEYAVVTAEFDTPRHMLDAPSRGWESLAAICDQQAAHIINLHPNCQGAFSEILRRADLAADHGISVMVGGTGYSGVGSWAHAHLASVIGLDFPYGEICGARDHGFPESTAIEMLPVVDGSFPVPDTPGHGGELNMDVVERYTEWTLDIP